MILVLIILITIYFIYAFKKELFDVTEYNSYTILDVAYDEETKQYENLLKNINNQDFPTNLGNFKPLKDINIQLKTSFNKSFLNYLDLIKVNSPFNNATFIPFSDAHTIYKNDDFYIFLIDIKNESNSSIRSFNVFVKVKDNDPDKIQILSTKIIGRIISTTFSGILQPIYNEDFDLYYRIKNKLHLMDPYLTSGKEMQITDLDKTQFEEILKVKEIEIKNLSHINTTQ